MSLSGSLPGGSPVGAVPMEAELRHMVELCLNGRHREDTGQQDAAEHQARTQHPNGTQVLPQEDPAQDRRTDRAQGAEEA